MSEDKNIKSVNFVKNTITSLSGELRVEWGKPDGLNYLFYNREHNIQITFGRDVMEDFSIACQGSKNSDNYRALDNLVRFRIYVALGNAGLIPKFFVSKQLLDEKRDWSKNISVSFEKQSWLYDIFRTGLKELAVFLEGIMKKYGTQPELEKEHADISKLLAYYNKHKSFTERTASDVSLGYLKAAAVAVILKKEKERFGIKIPRVLHVKNKEIYAIVDELRKDLFPQIKMPDCVYDYAKSLESAAKGEEAEGERKVSMQQNISCGPLAKESCDLLSSIEKDFSGNNVFLDIPYHPNYKVCETTLRSVLSELGFSPIAAKDKLTSNAVLCKVCRLIKTCAFGIADISSGSNSVTYEYGLMHGLGMKICLLLQKESEKFTDINALEHLTYSGVRNLCIELTRWLIDNIPGIDLEKANALIDRETNAIAESGDRDLPKLRSVVEQSNNSKSFLEKAQVSRSYNTTMVEMIKTASAEQKLFYMTATPIPLGLEIIDVNDEKIQKIIKSPSSNRSRGWTMSFYDASQDIMHTFNGIEKRLGELKLRLFRNGYVDFCTIVTESFSWGMDRREEKDASLFNPYSITEYPVSFFRLLRELSSIIDEFNSFHVSMGFFNCGEYALRPYGINTYGYILGREESKRSLNDWYFEKTFQTLTRENDSDAFIFSERIYNTFGFSEDKIPYFNREKVFEAKE